MCMECVCVYVYGVCMCVCVWSVYVCMECVYVDGVCIYCVCMYTTCTSLLSPQFGFLQGACEEEASLMIISLLPCCHVTIADGLYFCALQHFIGTQLVHPMFYIYDTYSLIIYDDT